jgi:hypothetical protein
MVKFNSDYAYEKADSSSDDDLAGEENESFLDQTRRQPASFASSNFKIMMVVLFVCSGLLNITTLGFIAYQYTRRGPSNPIFPQSLYCRFLDFLVSACILHYYLWCSLSAGNEYKK